MRFAINYSPQAEKLWREGRILVDLFTSPDWHALEARAGPLHKLSVHVLLTSCGRRRAHH